MNMSISKKLKVMMVIAIFSMMIVPITVFASNQCDSNRYRVQKQQNSVTECNQLYFCGTIENADGTEEYVYQDCTVTTLVDTHEEKCDKCGHIFKQQGVGERTIHSHGEILPN